MIAETLAVTEEVITEAKNTPSLEGAAAPEGNAEATKSRTVLSGPAVVMLLTAANESDGNEEVAVTWLSLLGQFVLTPTAAKELETELCPSVDSLTVPVTVISVVIMLPLSSTVDVGMMVSEATGAGVFTVLIDMTVEETLETCLLLKGIASTASTCKVVNHMITFIALRPRGKARKLGRRRRFVYRVVTG